MESREALLSGLSEAGLEMIDLNATDWSLPVEAAWMATACSPEEGRVDRLIAFDDPRLVETANEVWWNLAQEYRLFVPDGAFLLSVTIGDEVPRWASVRLKAEWDLFGAGTENGLLGGPRGRPGFVMCSRDGRVVIGGTTWHDNIGILAIPHSHRANAIRKYAVGMLNSPRTSLDDLGKVREWLDRDPSST